MSSVGSPQEFGYDVSLFVKTEDELAEHDLICTICRGIVREAVQTDQCGHLYCKNCITRWLRNHHNCPVCRHDLNSAQLRSNIYFQRKVKNLQVKCGENELCQAKGILGNGEWWLEHKRHCEYRSLICLFCEITLKDPESYAFHLLNTCPNIYSPCEQVCIKISSRLLVACPLSYIYIMSTCVWFGYATLRNVASC